MRVRVRTDYIVVTHNGIKIKHLWFIIYKFFVIIAIIEYNDTAKRCWKVFNLFSWFVMDKSFKIYIFIYILLFAKYPTR